MLGRLSGWFIARLHETLDPGLRMRDPMNLTSYSGSGFIDSPPPPGGRDDQVVAGDKALDHAVRFV